jgi:hypothetical protein
MRSILHLASLGISYTLDEEPKEDLLHIDWWFSSHVGEVPPELLSSPLSMRALL